MSKIIPLTQGQVAIVDDEDYDYLNQWRWCAHKQPNTYYAERHINGDNSKMISMHNLLLPHKRGVHTDHKDGNGLNNTRANIRLCSNQENQWNRRRYKNKTSKYKGVCWHKNRHCWQANIGGEYIGLFDTEEEAAKVYNKYAKLYYGEFAYLNEGV